MDPHPFGDWLRRQRKALDLTREGLADRVGCSAATIRKLETEERRPSAQIADIRLVTIIGPPGIGKTSLAIEAARTLLPDFPEGVFVVPLAAVEAPGLIAAAVARSLGLVGWFALGH